MKERKGEKRREKEKRREEKSDIGEEEQNGWFEVELTVGWNGVSSVLTCVLCMCVLWSVNLPTV